MFHKKIFYPIFHYLKFFLGHFPEELSGAPQMLWPDHCVQESKGAELDSLVKGYTHHY
jgi:nicotinamidase-related amidase